ncbi:hypothetical protein [Okeania sp. KiyG1]|uniref:hypothetical protein n=1 Tax=Okeania sp. KiyG1 TaxID=2720165 RepID=UPI0019205EE0|nr:hypothetical protein [Okeania sp. KiyG1]GGA58152.1 hypothetical protein CYANOKiyG1_79360 [Okeania sp. KiyG1]
MLLEQNSSTDTYTIEGFGNGRSNIIQGNFAANVIKGAGGDDTIEGSAGNDILTGGRGEDSFLYRNNLDLGFSFSFEDFRSSLFGYDLGVDIITDFNRNEDKILLDRDLFQIFDLGTDFESVNSIRAAEESNSLLVYNRRNGILYYNDNRSSPGFSFSENPNSGAFLVLQGAPRITEDNLELVNANPTLSNNFPDLRSEIPDDFIF